MSLPTALGSILHIPQFFVWRLTWDAEDRKYQKTPWRDGRAIDAQSPAAWQTYAAACEQIAAMRAQGETATLGWMMTAGCGYWFLDIDHCIGPDGTYSLLAQQFGTELAGCFIEFSSSGDGLHIIGRGELPAHSKRNKAYGLELYTEARGIAFGLTGDAWGSADAQAPGILRIVEKFFPPSDAASAGPGSWDGPRADWRGPADDVELLRRAMASASGAAKLGHKATFAQLWANVAELDRFYAPGSERDAALASHLAFWTGCDAPRMERLMRMSGLYRAKWDEHRTYLRELTIHNACAHQGDVLQDTRAVPGLYELPALPAVTTVAPVVSDETMSTIESLLDMVSSAGTLADVHNVAIPAIKAAAVPLALMPRLENAVNRRLEMFDSKMPVAQLRAALRRPATEQEPSTVIGRPEWAANYIYAQNQDKFMDLRSSKMLSRSALSATHNRDMPIKGDGPSRYDAVEFVLEHWGAPVVFDTMYNPAEAPIFAHGGEMWGNLYNPSKAPAAADGFTADCVAQIEQFQRLLWLQCGQRERVFHTMLCWMAHNVQRPGVKIRWCPIIKGTEGDGKSTIGSVMEAAMGDANVIRVGPDVVSNQGGFTDWAHGHALIVLEEIYVEGKERWKIVNALKPIVTNNAITINGKGDKPKKVINTANQLALTNRNDAVPMNSAQDRRWLVIFTPYMNVLDLYRDLGVTEGRQFFDPLYDSLHTQAGQWRKWLLEMPIPDWFDAQGSALRTDEKSAMEASGTDDIEVITRDLIEAGGYGFSRQVISSACLSAKVRLQAINDGVELPKGNAWHHTLNRMGFARIEKSLKWDGKAHRMWAVPGIDTSPDNLRKLLDATR